MKNKKCTRCGLDITPDKGSLCPPCLDDWSEEFLKCLDKPPPLRSSKRESFATLADELKKIRDKVPTKGDIEAFNKLINDIEAAARLKYEVED